MNIDTTRLMAVRPPKHINNCKISDTDPLSKSTIPREVEVILPDGDGSKILAMWHGEQAIAVDDYVRVRRDTSDMIYVIEGYGGGTAGLGALPTLDDLTDVTITGTPADNEVLAYDTGTGEFINQTAAEAGLGSGTAAWPADTKAMIDTTEYASIDAADTAGSAGDVVKVGGGTFTEQVTLGTVGYVLGTGRGTIITNSTSPTFTNAVAGAVLENAMVVNNNGTTATALDNNAALEAHNCKFHAHTASTTATAVDTSADLELWNCELIAEDASTKYGLYCTGSGKLVNLHNCKITGDVLFNGTITARFFNCEITGDLTVDGSAIVYIYNGLTTGDVTETSGDIVLIAPQVDGTVGAGVEGGYFSDSFAWVDL